MHRRDFISLLGGAAVIGPDQSFAQAKKAKPLVGFLLAFSLESPLAKQRLAALKNGLLDEGLAEGVNYTLVARFAEGDLKRYPQLADELSGLNVRVLVIAASLYGMEEFGRAHPELPVVVTAIAADLVALGIVQSYVRPGGKLTGNVMNALGGEEAMTQKRIGLFKELVPNLHRLGMIAPANGVLAANEANALKKVAADFGFELLRYDINRLEDIESAFAAAVHDDIGALYVSGEPVLFANAARVVEAVAASGKPSVGPYPDWARFGLLMSYSTDPLDGFRRAGAYAAKILNGAKPGDLPIEQASKFAFVINVKTANRLGIGIPAHLMALADEVVE